MKLKCTFRGRCNIVGEARASLFVAGAALLVKFNPIFSWQAQHFVKFKCLFSCQVQHLVKFNRHFSWQGQQLAKFKRHVSWEVQHLVKFKRHFSWLVQYLVHEVGVSLFVPGAALGDFLNDSLAAKCCNFQSKMLVVTWKSNLSCEAGCGLTVSCSDYGRIMLGSSPHCKWHFTCFPTFSLNFLQCHFSWQAQYLDVFGGSRHVLLRAL